MSIRHQLMASAMLAGFFSFTAQPALARTVAIDFGTSFDSNGENFQPGDSHFGANASGAVPFQLDFGSGAANYDFCFSQNGFVAFVASGSGCGAIGATPTGDYVSVYNTALTTGGNTSWGTGVIDTVAPYVTGETVPAIRFIWQATDAALNDILTELVIIDRGAGNFDLDLRYGSSSFGIDGAPAGGVQSLHLGSNDAGPATGPFATDTDYQFSFVGGVCSSCSVTTPPTTVDGPSILWLACLGFGLVFFGVVRRRGLLTASAAR